MDKAQLLEHATMLGNSPRSAIRLAWHTLTDERIARRYAKAQKAVTGVQRKLQAFERIGYVLAIVGTGVFVYENSSLLAAAIGVGLMLCFVTWMGIMAVRVATERILYGLGAGLALNLLAPAAGTPHAELAVKALTTGGQLTANWRDIALQERSQLRVFDVLILEALARAEWAAALPGREVVLTKNGGRP